MIRFAGAATQIQNCRWRFSSTKPNLILFANIAHLLRKYAQFESTRDQPKKVYPQGIDLFAGAATQIRTGDLILTKDALYRLSHSSGYG